MTTQGLINSRDLGVTLPHEHIFINMLRDGRETEWLVDYDLMVQETRAFKSAGGATIVDVTSAELSQGAAPDPGGLVGGNGTQDGTARGSRSDSNVLALQKLAMDTGLNVIVSTGHYRDPYLDRDWFDRHSTDQIAAFMVQDIEEGIGSTSIRAGIIGEVGADLWYISAAEERSLRAAARAQRLTNLSITTHAVRWPVGIAQLDLLESEGVDLRRVIIGHADSVNLPGYHEAVARRGAFIQYDNIRGNPYDLKLHRSFVLTMRDHGLLHKVLLSHDICRRSQLHICGGPGYDFILRTFSDELRKAGLDDEDVHQLLIDNPRRALTGDE